MSKNGKKHDVDLATGRTSEIRRIQRYNDGQERRRNYKYGDKLPITGNNPRPAKIDRDIQESRTRVERKKKAAKNKKKK